MGYRTRAGTPLEDVSETDPRHTGFIDALIARTLLTGFVLRDLKAPNIIELPDGRLSPIDLEGPLTTLYRYSPELERKAGSLSGVTVKRYRDFIESYLDPGNDHPAFVRARRKFSANPANRFMTGKSRQ